MKIYYLGDIHYHVSQYDLDKLAENIRDSCSSVDAVVVVGDITSSGRLDLMHDVLSTIRVVADASIMVVPGNHGIYLSNEEMRNINSLTKLHRFNDFVEELGCIALMKNHYIVNGIGFVGSIAWYDYSFAPEWLGLSIEDFRAKSFGLYTWADRDC